jgi:hypothetical protein
MIRSPSVCFETMSRSLKTLLFILFFFQAHLFATQIPGAITLMNDSPYILTATVYTHSGDYLGQVTLQPGQQKNFTTNLSSTTLSRPGSSDVSITPYRIIWTCPSGGVYSMARDGSVGSFVRASECPGPLSCSEKEPPKEEPKPGKK